VHRADLGVDELALLGGVLLTSVPRTLLDLARTLPIGHAVAAADSALRQGLLTAEDLWSAAGRLPPARGTSRVRDVVARVDPCSASVLESLCRLLLEDAGLRPFETQHVVAAGGLMVGRVDFAWPDHRVAVETDGFAFHSDRTRYRSDRRRGNALALAGWTVLRFSWEDVVSRPEVVVGQVRLALGR
jgi:very-short-patch-repair endonuclease